MVVWLVQLLALAAWADVHAALVDTKPPLATGIEVNVRPSDLQMLAGSMRWKSDREHRAFAEIAVYALANAYRKEAAKALAEPAVTRKQRRKRMRWSSATFNYASWLQGLGDGLEQAPRVAVGFGSDGLVQVFIADIPVLITGPRLGNMAMERDIVKAYCARERCEITPSRPEQRSSEPDGHHQLSTWDFDDKLGITFNTSEGIQFVFTDMSDRYRKQAVCLEFVEELKFVAQSLAAAQRDGHRIGWSYLGLKHNAGDEKHKVIINRRGDFLRLSLPSLGRMPSLWGQSRGWLRAKVEGREYRQVIEGAESLVARQLGGGWLDPDSIPCLTCPE